jgi:two-component system, sensor histidine kinase
MATDQSFQDRAASLRDLIAGRRQIRLQRLFLVALIGLAAAIAFDEWFAAFLWLCAFAVIQAVFTLGYGGLNRPELDEVQLRRFERLAVATAMMASIIYSAFSLVLWGHGAWGAALALLMLCGSLVHVTTTAFARPDVYWANAIPIVLSIPIGLTLGAGANDAGALASSVALALGLTVFTSQIWRSYRTLSQQSAALAAAHREALAAAEQARNANQAKSDFVAAISHELRTPLNGMRGGLELLARSALRPEQLELVDAMQSASDAQVRLLNDLLDLAKIEAGKLDVELAPYAPRVLAHELITLFAPAAAHKGLGFELDIAPDVPERVVGDEFRVRQIVSNLISNAIKFTPTGGVRISLRAGARDNGAGALFWAVRDTGIGLAPNTKERLFVAFVQGGPQTARNYGGSGLGLAISKRLAELLAGDITVASEPGKGSEFTLATPLLPASTSSAVIETDPPAAPATGFALVADDHRISRLVLMRFLEGAGWHCVSAADGQGAVSAAAAQKFDLIMLDANMPGLDGIGAAQAIRLGGPNQQTAMVLVSADGVIEPPNGLFDARLLKPISADAVMAVLSAARPEKAAAAA